MKYSLSYKKNKRTINKVVLVFLFVIGLASFNQVFAQITINRISSDVFIFDSNKPDTEGPRAAYVGYRITNTSGSTLTGLSVTLDNFVEDVVLDGWLGTWELTGGQAATQVIGTLAGGESRVFFWYVSYPVKAGEIEPNSLSVDVTVSDGSLSAGITDNLGVSKALSAAAEASLEGIDLIAGGTFGGLVITEVTHSFGLVTAGDGVLIQPAGNLSFDAGAFQLIGSEVMLSTFPGITVGATDSMWYVADARYNKPTVIVRYYFRNYAINTATAGDPYAASWSGGAYKYTGNYGDPDFAIDLPVTADSLIISKTASNLNPLPGDSIQYTVTISNVGSDTTSVDTVVDILPEYFSFLSCACLAPGDDFISSNLPVLGDEGTINFVGGVSISGSLYQTYRIAPGTSMILVFNVLISDTAPNNTYINSVNYSIAGTRGEFPDSATVLICNVEISGVNVVDPTGCVDDGSITITSTGSNLEYSVDNGATFQPSNLFENLAAGTYDIIVRDSLATTCFDTWTLVILTATPDTELPVIINCPSDITQSSDAGVCNATVTWTEPTATDNCTEAGSLVWAKSHLPGATFTLGPTTVTYTATDAAGNISLVCSFDVTIEDDENPTISCPSDVTVNADAGLCTASGVSLGTPTTDDNCSVASVTNDALALFPVGNTTVTWIVTDGAGNIATCEQIVTVEDNENPSLSCPSNIEVIHDNGICGAVVSYTAPVGTDNCTEETTTLTSGLGSGSTFPVGTTTETYTVTDASGNETSCSFTVTVLGFNIAVSDISTEPSGNHCPKFLPPFNADNEDYNPGTTEVTFRVDKELSGTGSWSFDFAIDETGDVEVYDLTLSGNNSAISYSGADAGGTLTAGDNTEVTFTFQIKNVPGTELDVIFNVSNGNDGDCAETGTTSDNSVTHTISVMPAVGGFN